MARREVARLNEHLATVLALDDVDRSLTEADLFDDSHPELKRLRRYESQLHTRLRRFLADLKYESPHFKPHPDLKPRWGIDFDEDGPAEGMADGATDDAPAEEVHPSIIDHPPIDHAKRVEPKPKRVEPKPKPEVVAEGGAKEKPFEFWRSVLPNPPFDLELEEYPEPGQEADIPAILASRREKKAKKAEARRESRRRKLEKLRA